MFILMATIFLYLFVFTKLDNNKLLKVDFFIEKIIQLNIVFILLDTVAVNFLGMQSLIFNMFNEVGYRIMGASFFVHYRPNGLVLGPQHASVLSVVGILRWVPLSFEWRRIGFCKLVWLGAACLLFLISMTTTAVLCLSVCLLFLAFSGLVMKKRLGTLGVAVASIFLVSLICGSLIIDKYSQVVTRGSYLGETGFSKYSLIYTDPIIKISNDPFNALIGTGVLSAGMESQYPNLLIYEIEHADFGLMISAVTYGIIVVTILITFYIIYLLKAVKYIGSIKQRFEADIALRLILISLALVVSTVHYGTLLNNGIFQLFAAVIALSWAFMRGHKKVALNVWRNNLMPLNHI